MEPTPELVDAFLLPHGASHIYHEQKPLKIDHQVQRIDGLVNLQQHEDLGLSMQWDIDGGETDRGFFCTVPTFARHRPPRRITTSLSWADLQYDEAVSKNLGLKDFFRAGKWNIHNERLTQYIRSALTAWSSAWPSFETDYDSLPFGSSIVIDALDIDHRAARVRLVPDDTTEQSWLSLQEFANQTGILHSNLIEMTVSWDSLKLVSHPHENISIVRVAGQSQDMSYVFKGLMQDTQYMYHELRLLLSMDAHSNIMAKPKAIVLKQRSGKDAGIAGFLLDLYSGPTLQQRLQYSHPPISMAEKIDWSRQLVLALLHVQHQLPTYFPDFKPNNVILTIGPDGKCTPVLLDFEQRGTWYTWTPPEVKYVEYFELLATSSPHKSVRERNAAFLSSVLPEWSLAYKKRSLREANLGYNVAWVHLSPEARSKAQIYPLGKVLWCIFEGLPSPDGLQSVESFLEDFLQDQQFPDFRSSPMWARHLIRRCTAGAPEWCNRSPAVVRSGDRIIPRGKDECEVTAVETREAASRWWGDELRLAEKFVRHEYMVGEHGHLPAYVEHLRREIQDRPSLEEILNILQDKQSAL